MDGDGELGQELIENASPGTYTHSHSHHRFSTNARRNNISNISNRNEIVSSGTTKLQFDKVRTCRCKNIILASGHIQSSSSGDSALRRALHGRGSKGLQRVRYGSGRVVFQNERCSSGYAYLSQRYQDVLHCRCERSLATSLDGERAFHYHRNGHQQGGQKHHLCRYRWSRGQRAVCIVCESSSCMERCENS